jgi:hypothetical protein
MMCCPEPVSKYRFDRSRRREEAEAHGKWVPSASLPWRLPILKPLPRISARRSPEGAEENSLGQLSEFGVAEKREPGNGSTSDLAQLTQ